MSIGNKRFIEAQEHGNIPLPPECVVQESITSFYVATQQEVIREICLVDKIKPDARQTIDILKERGLEPFILLSGDKQAVAQSVAQTLGISQAYGEVMPDKKLEMLKGLQETRQV